MTASIPEDTKARLRQTASEINTLLVFKERNDNTDLLEEALAHFGIEEKAVRLLFFYSDKDVEYALGWANWSKAIEARKVWQHTSIGGMVQTGKRRVYLKDLCGWAGKKSLSVFAESLGLNMIDKGLMDDCKSHMYNGLIERPEEFLRYSLGDVPILIELHSAFIENFRMLQRECLDMAEEDLWTAEDIPMTIGALVAKTFERWLYRRGTDADIMKFCVRKLGILDPDARQYHFNKRVYQQAIRQYREPTSLRNALDDEQGNKTLRQFFKARFLHTALDACSVKWFADIPPTNSACFNALVQGGRCHNENPFSYSMGRCLDLDISGCYGEALRALSYPVGLPTIWSFTPNQTHLTFGQWLDKYESQLEPGLWTVTISGQLTFEQDLIHSKLVKAGDISKAARQNDDSKDINSNFVMLRKQIQNGIIDSGMCNALRQVATAEEWAGFRSEEVVTAVAYLKSDRMHTIAEWCAAVMKDRGEYSSYHGNIRDSRTKAWFPVPLEDFIGRLADRRKHYKKLAKSGDSRAAGMDAMLKLTVNTFYGVMASRFFTVGNTVVANNITARARLGVWQMAKALGGRQTITDGIVYEPIRVCFFGERKAGLDTLSRVWEWHMPKRHRKFGPLKGLDWTGEKWPDNVDELALTHVKDFWKPYGLSFPFELEHKQHMLQDGSKTIYITKSAYWSKADYALELPDGTVKYALRGKDKKRKDHPSFELLDSILKGEDGFPTNLTYFQNGRLKIGKYQIVQNCNGYEHLKHLRPGDDYKEKRTARYNNNYFPMNDQMDFERRRNRKKVNRGKSVQWFEKYADRGIAAVHQKMEQNILK